MKKIFTLSLLMSGIAYSVHAQLKISGTNPIPVSSPDTYVGIKHNSAPLPMVIDTLEPPVITDPCFTGDPQPLVYYNWAPPASGYVTGNDSLPQQAPSPPAIGTECAQRYAFSGTGSINEVLILYAYVVGTTGSTTAKIYSVNASKTPQTVLGASAPILTGALTTTAYVTYSFSPPVPVTTDFAASAVFPTNGDTVAIVSTKLTCHSADSLSSKNFSPYGWFLNSYLFNFTQPPDTGLDLMILPVIDIGTGTDSYPSANGLILLGAYPNPANDFTNIRYRTDEPSEVSVRVFDISGRVIKESTEKLDAGVHELNVNVKLLSAGNYYYTIKTNNGILTSKFVVE